MEVRVVGLHGEVVLHARCGIRCCPEIFFCEVICISYKCKVLVMALVVREISLAQEDVLAINLRDGISSTITLVRQEISLPVADKPPAVYCSFCGHAVLSQEEDRHNITGPPLWMSLGLRRRSHLDFERLNDIGTRLVPRCDVLGVQHLLDALEVIAGKCNRLL